MKTLKCAFSWLPDVVQSSALRTSLPTRVALILHEWGKGGRTRFSNFVGDGTIPVKATVKFRVGLDTSAWQDLIEIAKKESICCEQMKEPPAAA
ncbi:hypothetical protein HNP48_002007 [Acidovorax soli]|uniref:Uncharacterized protein n=1 Tax=Acidovorax soli TaxID=592050 RepID=A0A7X0PCF7_9BURK|nr:hypothetical protein [Acidovorax soli]MBB6559340.1 hypothetical protein [Acidovorax soli]